MGRHQELPRLRTKGGYWVAAFYRNGRRTETSFGPVTRPREDAAADLHRLVASLINQPSGAAWLKRGKAPDYNIANAIGEYLTEIEATKYGGKNGLVTAKSSLKHLDQFAGWKFKDFGARAYGHVVANVISYRTGRPNRAQTLTRSGVKQRLCYLRHFFRWAVSKEYATGDILDIIRAHKIPETNLMTLSAGTTKRSVSDDEFRETLARVSPPYDTILRLLRLTGARPSEICGMRPVDIEQLADDAWIYRPESHKTKRLGKHRVIVFEAKCIELLRGHLVGKNPEELIFRLGTRRSGSKPSYTANTMGLDRHVRGVQDKHGLRRWAPYDLRRTMATKVTGVIGKEAAMRLLGHSNPTMTERYIMTDPRHLLQISRQANAAGIGQLPAATSPPAPPAHDAV
jgi:integrase